MSTVVALPLSLQPIESRKEDPPRSRPDGPGWFDSSWELRAGLQVKEGLPVDLGLCAWVESWLQLVGGGSGLSLSAIQSNAAQRRAARTASPNSTTAIA